MGDYLSSQVCSMFQCVGRQLRALADRLTTAEGEIDVLQTFQNSHVGAMLFSIRTADFEGWLLCDGRAVSRDTYSVLFTLIGTQFGSGDGTTTFNLPDGTDRVIGVKGVVHAIGDTAGSESATLTVR
jgi:hypothetical protein